MGSAIGQSVPINTTAFGGKDIAKNMAGWIDRGDSGTGLSNLDRAGGGIKLTMDGTDNDCETAEYGGESVNPLTVGTRFGFEAVIKVTEADTSDSDWFIGFSDTATNGLWADTDTLVSGVHIGFAKYTASMFFRRIMQQAATNSGDTAATTRAFASATEYRLRMEAVVGTVGIEARYYVDEVLLGTGAVSVATTSYGLMSPCFSISTNGTNAEVFELLSFIPYNIPA